MYTGSVLCSFRSPELGGHNTRAEMPETPVRFDVDDRWSGLEMDMGSQQSQKELRAEIEEAIYNHEDDEVDLG